MCTIWKYFLLVYRKIDLYISISSGLNILTVNRFTASEPSFILVSKLTRPILVRLNNPMNTKPITFLFSGHGAQFYQMGMELFEKIPDFRKFMEEGNGYAEPILGSSVLDVLYKQRDDKFNPPFDKTLFTHPAIVMFEYSLARTLMERGIEPDYLLGYSLGEIVAHSLAGTIDYRELMRLISKQAVLMDQKTEPGTMLAVITAPEYFDENPDLFKDTWLAGINFANHFVVTGRIERINQLEEDLRDKDVLNQPLPITTGFHSPLIESIEKEFKADLDALSFQPMKLPLISSTLKRTLKDEDITTTYFWRIIRETIQFKDTLTAYENNVESFYIDVGPAGTLSTFVKYALGAKVQDRNMTIVTMMGEEEKSLNEVYAALGK